MGVSTTTIELLLYYYHIISHQACYIYINKAGDKVLLSDICM